LIRTRKKIPLHRIIACIVLFLISVSVAGCATTPKRPFLRDYALKRDIFVGAAVRPDKLTAFVTWGVTDKYSWLPWFSEEGLNEKIVCSSGLLFDENCRGKPAYYAIIEKLKKDKKY